VTVRGPVPRARVERLLAYLREGLIQRDEASRLVLLAALAGEHVLLIGPPGTAKSLLARRLAQCLSEASFFERLLTRFSVPEELFGPLSIQSLERDEYRRLTVGYLPTATVAFLDEVFKANSAILNALLTLLNEREFDNGAGRERTPLVCVVGASNEVPEGDELAALYDRFLFRVVVDSVSDDAFEALLAAPVGVATPAREDRLSPDDLGALRERARRVVVPPAVTSILAHLRRELRARSLYVSDRRWRQLLDTLRVAALTQERSFVTLADLWLAEHAIWQDPEQRETTAALLGEAFAEVLVKEPQRFHTLAKAFQARLEKEREQQEPQFDDEGRPMFVDDRGDVTLEHRAEARRFRPPPDFENAIHRSYTSAELWDKHFSNRPNGLAKLEAWTLNPASHVSYRMREPALGPRRFESQHVARRREQVMLVLEDVTRFRTGLEQLREASSPWVDPERLEAYATYVDAALEELEALEPVLRKIAKLADELPRVDAPP